ncbi:hypothetical protein THRCLA_21424 [Thraustotheca clavata]|uniref:Uncharacterized protein n=1 Tax=Thraustotheca clavata TaxID=74557 RepID=A0A1V9ZWR4_9STRA|nr:hypothetical protein THRCLA_21424 [Thraustotheca clavata]
MSGDEPMLPTLLSSRSSSDVSSRSKVDSSYNNESDEDTESPTCTGELYQEIESFLTKPSPSLAMIAKGSRSTDNLLPTLKQERSRLRTEKPEYKKTSSIAKKTPLDLNLVHQAFAYAKSLQNQILLETTENADVEDHLQNVIHEQLAKAHICKSNHTLRSKIETKKLKKKPIKTKSTTAIYSSTNKADRIRSTIEWDNNKNDANSKSSSMDPQLVQQLLSNFENGTTLTELRMELAASQASLKESRNILQGAAKSFFLKQQ